MTETPAILPSPEMPTTIPDTGVKRPNTDAYMTYLKKNNIDEAIHQKPRKKDVYETDMHNIYNITVGQTNKQLNEKVASDTTLQAVKTGRYPIGLLLILKKLCFSNQYEKHPIRSLRLAKRRLHNTTQNVNDNTTDYVVRFGNAQRVNKACNGSLTSRGVQEHGMKILYALHVNGFDALSENYKKGEETAG